MLYLGTVGPMVNLLGKERDFRLTPKERLLLSNNRSGKGSMSVCKVDREVKMVYPTDVALINTAEMPDSYCLVNELVWARTVSGEDLLFPGDLSYGLVEKVDLVGACKSMNMSGEHKDYVLDDENLRMVYIVDRITLSDDDCVEIAARFDQRFPVYGLKNGRLTRVIYQSQWLAGEDLAIWKVGVRNVIWSPVAKLLFRL